MIKSDFQQILPEDCKQYQELAVRYGKLNSEDGTEAYELMQMSWAIAQRWSEIQASTAKIASGDYKNILKTDFKTWAYQRYRQSQLIHESCRVIWRQANEYEIYLKKQNKI